MPGLGRRAPWSPSLATPIWHVTLGQTVASATRPACIWLSKGTLQDQRWRHQRQHGNDAIRGLTVIKDGAVHGKAPPIKQKKRRTQAAKIPRHRFARGHGHGWSQRSRWQEAPSEGWPAAFIHPVGAYAPAAFWGISPSSCWRVCGLHGGFGTSLRRLHTIDGKVLLTPSAPSSPLGPLVQIVQHRWPVAGVVTTINMFGSFAAGSAHGNTCSEVKRGDPNEREGLATVSYIGLRFSLPWVGSQPPAAVPGAAWAIVPQVLLPGPRWRRPGSPYIVGAMAVGAAVGVYARVPCRRRKCTGTCMALMRPGFGLAAALVGLPVDPTPPLTGAEEGHPRSPDLRWHSGWRELTFPDRRCLWQTQ